MTFYLLQEGNEVGPFTWVEIYAFLRNNQISYDDLVREEGSEEFQKIQELGLWNEGCDVGPLTWEEILFLREKADLREKVLAKIEGEADFSTLENLIQERPALFKGKLLFHRLLQHLTGARIAFVAGSVVILLAILMFMLPKEHSSKAAPQTAPIVEIMPPFQASTAVVPEINPPVVPEIFEESPDKEGALQELTKLGSPQLEPSKSPNSEGNLTGQEQLSNTGSAGMEDQEVATIELPSPEVPSTTSEVVTELVESSTQESTPTDPPTEEEPSTSITSTSPSPKPSPKALLLPEMTEVSSHYFTIHSIKLLAKPGRDGIGAWEETKDEKGKPTTGAFLESVVVEVSTKHHTAAKDLFARAYFYDRSGNLVAAQKAPAKAGKQGNRAQFAMPVLFQEEKQTRLYFPIPSALKGQRWQAVVVFGDKDEAKAISYPKGTSYVMLDFPEKKLVTDRTVKIVQRKKLANRVVEYVSKTRNPKHPQITLFLRPPKGIDDWSEVKGVYALVVLASNVEEIRRRMQADELGGDESGTFAFANKHKLAVLMWGSQRTWNPGMNYDDYERRQGQELDRDFDYLADAWERGVQHFHKEYGIPTRNFFLQGNCGAAQWAKRLCLRKPDYFIATHIHMPGSYDRPTPEAAKVLWCLTIGELEGGYERSIRWVKAARDMGYPLIYKPIPGLGHSGHPTANKLAHETFEFAMKRIADREAYDEQLKRRIGGPEPEHWLKEFVNPPYFADFINQEVFPSAQVDMIPEPFRIPIPTKGIADVWMQAK